MTYNATQIANWFINRAERDGRSLSIMSLLKLTYIAHGWRLEITDRPLFNNRIEAWQYGPVIPDVYRAFRSQGVDVVNPLPGVAPISAPDEPFLEEIWKLYGGLSAFQLSDITHVPGGPWSLATQMGGNYAHIPDELIKQHYKGKRVRAAAKTANVG